jgi:hypothetical protein
MQRIACQTLSTLLAIAALLPGCAYQFHPQGIYVSPFNGNSGEYHPLPLLADSTKTAFYAQTAVFGGSGNVNHNDRIAGGNASLYLTHRFGWFQCFSGLSLTFGDYNARHWDTNHNWSPPIDPTGHLTQLNAYTGHQFFGGTGFSGGINFVIPLGGGCEWRIAGMETNLQREFGAYRRFRGKLPDTLTALDIRDRFFGTIGVTSEFVIRGINGVQWGFRVSRGWSIGAPYRNLTVYDSIWLRPLQYHYGNVTAQVTAGRYTVYFQVDGGTKFNTAHLGFVYRLTRPRRSAGLPVRGGGNP